MNSNQKGNIALGKAISYFTEENYIVSLPLNDSQCYDLIIEKEGKLQMVQVKYTSQIANSGKYFCKLQTKNQDKVFYTLKDTYCDLLYCYCSNGDEYLVPIKDIINETHLTLTIEYKINNTQQNNMKKIDTVHTNKTTIVYQYDLEGNFINSYNNYSEAARAIGKMDRGASNHISEVCKGKRKTAYGYQWRN